MAHAYETGQLTMAHKVDGVISAALFIGAAIPVTAPIFIPVGFVYGGARLIIGGVIDQKINQSFH
jgi:hypothetical protein